MSGGSLQALAEAMLILPSWRDLRGEVHTTTPETQRALLAAMGVPAASDAEAAESLRAHRARVAARRLPEELVIKAGGAARIPLRGPVDWCLELEDGGEDEGRAEEELVVAPPAGLHRLVAGGETCLLIVAPERTPGVAEVLGRERAWGVTAALYGLRSRRNLGVGDYRDLAAAAAGLAGLGADFIGVNPVHAHGAAGGGISPYSPSCRTAFETRHIAVDSLPGQRDSAELRRIMKDAAARLKAARSGDFADYATCAAIGSKVLRALFAEFVSRESKAAGDFAAWRRARGRALERFALFEAISLEHGGDWRSWPVPLRSAGGAAAAAFEAEHATEVSYHAWLQWLADGQVAAAQSAAKDAGMGLGLYLDVAVGVRPGGADTWSAPDCFAAGVSLGAPPDALGPDGQDWALAPFRPGGLRAAGYRPFVEMLRAAMAHAGIIRIDHAIGLQQSFWVPKSGAPGGYVGYPLEALLALIRLESRRSNCIVVGEDLGSVPRGLRERLSGSGLLGCAVMQFEKQRDRFRPPAAYRATSLASFGTHDTPTMRGWWSGWDIEQRHEIARRDPRARAADWERRAKERRALAGLLSKEGLAPADLDPVSPSPLAGDAPVDALHRLLARTGASLVAVQLDDALGASEQQNLPGTIDEHPNWRRRYRVAVEDLAGDPGLRALTAIFERPAFRGPAFQETQP